MKKILLICLLAVTGLTANSQTITEPVYGTLMAKDLGTEGRGFSVGDNMTLQVRINGYTTNLWTALITGLNYAFAVHVDREMPGGLGYGRMNSPYRRTFSHPFHRFGDLAVGPSASLDFNDNPLGFFAGLKYKTHEVFYDKLGKNHDNDRVHYISPELGLRFNWGEHEVDGMKARKTIECGLSYDAVVGYNGHVHDYSNKAAKSGFNFILGIGYTTEKGSTVLKYTHPLHNFYNEGFSPDGGISHPLDGFKYKIGLIALETRVTF